MKRGKIFTNCVFNFLLLSLLVLFSNCSADGLEDGLDMGNNNSSLSTSNMMFTLKAFSNNEDITSKGEVDSVYLYVFDEKNDFVTSRKLDRTYLLQAKPIEIKVGEEKSLNIVALSGLGSSINTSGLDYDTFLSNLSSSLKSADSKNTPLSKDLFFGELKVDIKLPMKSSAQELRINRKSALLTLTSTGIIKIYDSKEGEFYYKVKNVNSVLNADGSLSENTDFIIPAILNEKGLVVSKAFMLLPSKNIVVELYRDDKMIFSSENQKNAQQIDAIEGNKTNIIFDISSNKSEIFVTDWTTVSQIVTIN